MKKLIYFIVLILFIPVLQAEPDQVTEPQIETPRATRGDEIRALWDTGQKSEAFKQAKKWRKEESKNADSYLMEAELFCENGQFKKCLKRANKAAKFTETDPKVFYWKGRAYAGLKKDLEAANEFKAALIADPNYQPASVGLARVSSELRGMDKPTAPESSSNVEEE